MSYEAERTFHDTEAPIPPPPVSYVSRAVDAVAYVVKLACYLVFGGIAIVSGIAVIGICLLIPFFGWIALIVGVVWLLSHSQAGDARPMTTTEALLCGFIIGRR